MKTILHVSDIKARPADVFRALSTTGGLASWWTTGVAGDAGPGGVVIFTFAGDFNPSMRVDKSEPSSTVEWTCVEGVVQWADNTFSFELEDRDVATRLRFRQDYATELSNDDYGTYNYNWGYYLESLRGLLETGQGKPFAAA